VPPAATGIPPAIGWCPRRDRRKICDLAQLPQLPLTGICPGPSERFEWGRLLSAIGSRGSPHHEFWPAFVRSNDIAVWRSSCFLPGAGASAMLAAPPSACNKAFGVLCWAVGFLHTFQGPDAARARAHLARINAGVHILHVKKSRTIFPAREKFFDAHHPGNRPTCPAGIWQR
jgi:hypothetical protein